MSRMLVTLLLSGFVILSKAQEIDFFAESLTFKLQDGFFELNGLYYFRNRTDIAVKQMLFYPFPDPEQYGEITYFSCSKNGDHITLPIRQLKDGVLFPAHLSPDEEAEYHICYGQLLRSNEARYIILSTRQWNKPFEIADYRLEFPDSIVLTHVSIEPDTIYSMRNKIIYEWHRENFMPDSDFEFKFESALQYLQVEP